MLCYYVSHCPFTCSCNFSYTIPLILFNLVTSAGSIEDAWFDPVAILESDCDEDYQSVPDGMLL